MDMIQRNMLICRFKKIRISSFKSFIHSSPLAFYVDKENKYVYYYTSYENE